MKYRIFLKYGPKNQNKEEENNFLFEGIFFPGVRLIVGTIRYQSFQNVAIKKKQQETEYRTGKHKRVITFTIYNTILKLSHKTVIRRVAKTWFHVNDLWREFIGRYK